MLDSLSLFKTSKYVFFKFLSNVAMIIGPFIAEPLSNFSPKTKLAVSLI